MKAMIFHLPYPPNPKVPSGGNLRPLKMLEAFKKIGYVTDVVMGSGSLRRRQIREIKKKINEGFHYDFLYSESSSMPTLLTQRHHWPTAPFLDFGFFRFCKQAAIPIGLFYRDIYWRFEAYGSSLSWIKKRTARFFYEYDLRSYNALVDILFLPSVKMAEYIPMKLTMKLEALPSGCEPNKTLSIKNRGAGLTILYVGAIDAFHNLRFLFRAVKERQSLRLVVSCRADQWKEALPDYQESLTDRITVVHEQGNALDRLYEEADLLALFFKPTDYRSFAMPYKLFEYLSYSKPMIAAKNTTAGDFVEANDVGWSIDYDPEAFVRLTDKLIKNPDELKRKQAKIAEVIPLHLWETRAKTVSDSLTRSTNV